VLKGVARQMDLAILAHDLALAVDEDRGVEAPLLSAFHDQLGIAEVEADAELPALVEKRRGLRARHLGLVEAVELGLVLDQPAREEGGKAELGEDDEFRAARLGIAHHLQKPPDRILAGL